jgi:phage terminase large subunit GpA-like protein
MESLWAFEPLQRLILFRSTFDRLLPPPKIRTFDWICDHIRTKDGLPFNPIDYPWTEGICDEWDNPQRNTIWLQFAARLGKSLIAMAMLIKSIATEPAPAMMATATAPLLKSTIADKFYPMFEKTPITRKLVPPLHLRNKTQMDLSFSKIYGGWSGSATSLADKDPRYKWGFEVDKWSSAKSEEADPLELFVERGIEIPDKKTVLEGTPATALRSRVNRGLVRSTNCRFVVPCKWCKQHQQLIRGNGDPKEGGLIWDKDKDGRSNSNLAFKTARYVCRHCHREIHDEDRRPMIRKGIWCPSGCTINKKGKLIGTPFNDGPDAGFQLGRLYAPTFSFGDHAKHWIESQGDPEAIRNHVNSWDGEVWQPIKVDCTWEQLAERLCVAGMVWEIVPSWGIFLTCGIDVQIDHWVYAVSAWGRESVGATIEYGILNSWTEVKDLLAKTYKHADGGADIPIRMSLIDARDGNKTDEVTAFCKSVNKADGPWVYPSMGQDTAKMSGRPWYRNEMDAANQMIDKKSQRRGLSGFYTIMINTNYWERWCHNCLFFRTPGEPRSLGITAEAKEDQDLFEQLLNVQPELKKKDGDDDSDNRWVRVNRAIPKDLRDAIRYSRVGADVYTSGNWNRVPLKRPTPIAPPAKRPSVKPADQQEGRPGSWVRRLERDRFVRRPAE